MLLNTFKKIRYLYSRKEKKGILLLLLGSIVGGILEIGGIGVIIPLVSYVLNPDFGFDLPVFQFISQWLRLDSIVKSFIFMSLLIVFFYALKNAYLVLFQHFGIQFRYKLYQRHSGILFRKYMYSPYSYHINRNSADLLRNLQVLIIHATMNFSKSLIDLINIIILSLMLVIFMFFVNWQVTLVFIILSGIFAFLYFVKVKDELFESMKRFQKALSEKNKAILQGIGNIKVTKILHKEKFYNSYFDREILNEKSAITFNSLVSIIPRYIVEVFILAIILFYINYLLFKQIPTETIFTELTVVSLIGLKLFPKLSGIMSQFSRIRMFIPAIDLIYDEVKSLENIEIKICDFKDSVLAFNDRFQFDDISFSYPGKEVIKNLSLTFEKGKTYGFVGESGAGKTTLIDIILGLLHPQSGKILLDGQNINDKVPEWQMNMSYIPQNIYLFDDTIRKNVAICRTDDEINEELVWDALDAANLKDFVKTLKYGLETRIGESGVKLSGGQRQRLGIARALYEEKSIIIMDEATASLDYVTEKEIMRVINKLHNRKTLIIVAHRLATIKECDVIFFMENGKIRSSGSYQELKENDSKFQNLVKLNE